MIPPVASRFVAGESPAAALEHAREQNAHGLGVILNLLGEHYERRAPADDDTEIYCRLLQSIAEADLGACLSPKPTQLGLDVSESVFRENLARLVETAEDCGGFVWLDMEGPETVDATLDAYEHHAGREGCVGVAIQANMKRTGEDLHRLAGLPGKVRLVKGAYDPPAAIAYQEKRRVDQAYRDHLEYMFEHFDDGVAVGSHDPAMIELAADLHDDVGTPYEVQMLMGVREDAQRRLAADREVWQYVPFGERWLSYFYRRLAEGRENLTFALRALWPF